MRNQKGVKLSFNQPMLLPASLQAMHQALAGARGEAAISKAATAIIKKYCETYEPGSIQQDLQRLIIICGEQQNLCLFYEFTLLMLEALYALHKNPKALQPCSV
jgi:hypothetical protein